MKFYIYTIFLVLLLYNKISGENLNVEITNTKKREILKLDSQSISQTYKIKNIEISYVDGTKIDELLKNNILNILTFQNGDYVNLKTSIIQNNINRIKKLFKDIKDVSIYGDFDKNNDLLVTIKIEFFEKFKDIIFDRNNENNDKLNAIREKYIGKILKNKEIDDIKNEVKKNITAKTYFKIITNKNKEYIFKVFPEKSKQYFVEKVSIVGAKSLEEQKIIENLEVKGSKYYSIGYNLISLIKKSQLNNFNLFEAIGTLKSRFFIWNNIIYDKDKIKNDKNKIINFYISNGFLDVKVNNVKIIYDNKKNLIDIEYHISEGKQYFIGEVDIIGNKNINANELKKVLDLEKGAPFNYIEIKNKISDTNNFNFNNIKKIYNSIGYLKANITLKIKSINNNVIDIAFIIEEGEKTTVNKIKVIGNKYVNSTEFYRDSFLFPGDTYDLNRYIATQQNIMRSAFVEPKKSFVTLDNENNINMIVKEKIGFQPIFNLSGTKIEEDECCQCCRCCTIGPAVNIGAELTNLNLKKLLHLKDKRYSFLGNGDIAKLILTYSPVDSKFNTELGLKIREITKGISIGLSFNYQRYRGNIDNKENKDSKDKNKKTETKKKSKKCCEDITHNISLNNTIIFSNFNSTVVYILRPIYLSVKIGENAFKTRKKYIDINIYNELKYTTITNTFMEKNGLEAAISVTLTNPFLFIKKDKDKDNTKINKYINILSYLNYYKELYNNIVFSFNVNFGYNKSFNKYLNSFKIEKDDKNDFATSNSTNKIYMYLKGLNENSFLTNLINKCECNMAFKVNVELRYLFLSSRIINSYLFGFFNGCNLFIPENKFKYRELKQYGKCNLYNPFRFFSFGIGIRFEPEILKIIIPNVSFSLYYDFKNKEMEFSIIGK